GRGDRRSPGKQRHAGRHNGLGYVGHCPLWTVGGLPQGPVIDVGRQSKAKHKGKELIPDSQAGDADGRVQYVRKTAPYKSAKATTAEVIPPNVLSQVGPNEIST